jgi:hypothetical protein
MVADPSTHSKRETMASVCWSWEAGGAAHGNLQILSPGKVVLASEQALPEEVARLAACSRLERVGAFRQMQALSNVIRGLGNKNWPDLTAFCLPEDWQIHPVTGNQVRVLRTGPETDTAYLVDSATRERQPVLPDAALAATQGEGVNLLVLGLDQGSVGAAGAAFLDRKGFMVHTKWDKFHRCIRDLKLTLQNSCGGVFLKAQLYTSYLWGVNYKPFGTGLFGTQKTQALNTFVATETADSTIFRKHMDRIARDVRLPCGTLEEREQLFHQLPQILGSFVRSESLSKLGRWFSWHACAEQQLPEYWAAKMLYEHHLSAENDPDDDPVAFEDLEAAARAKTPFAELMQLKAANGGLRLAYKLMTHQLWQHAQLLLAVTRPCWSWYTREVKNIKSAGDGLRDALTKTRGRWMRDPQLYEIVSNCFGHGLLASNCSGLGLPASTRKSFVDVLSDIGMAEGPSRLAEKMCTLSLVLMGHRAWSMAVRHHGPPECYADLLSSVEDQAQRAANDLKKNWQALLRLEQRSLTYAPAKRLLEDIHYARNMPVRLLHVLFERDKFRSSCRPGLHVLRGMLDALPDNKIVEDIHNVLRRHCGLGKNRKRCTTTLQNVTNATKVLEERGIPHPAQVTKFHFLQCFNGARAQATRKQYYSARHRLPKSLTEIMGRKVWPTVSETWSRKGIAAWIWLQEGYGRPCPNAGPGEHTLQSALFSRLVAPEMILLSLRSVRVMASLGHASWAVLFWPVHVLATDEHGMRSMRLPAPDSPFFGHITDPSHWHVVPYTPELRQQGIVLQQCGPPETLVQACLRRPQALSHEDLVRLAASLDTGNSTHDSRGTLLESIARRASENNADFVSLVRRAESETLSVQAGVCKLLQDPVFEAAYGEIPDDDKLEFPEIRLELRKGRVRQHMADRVVQTVRRKRRKRGQPNGPLPKRRVRARRVAAAPLEPASPAADAAAPSNGSRPPPPVGPAADGPNDTPVPEVAPQPAAGAEPPAAEALRDLPALRIPRGQPWGRGRFIIARTHRAGELQAVTVTCLLHSSDNARCNKNLNLGSIFSEEEATRRIKEWCVRGLDIPAADGARELHMHGKGRPRFYSDAELRSQADLEALGHA